MGPLDSFFQLVFDSPGLYFMFLILSSLLYTLIFRRYIYSLFDPFVLFVVTICFGSADVFMMYYKDHISTYYLGSYVFTQAFFLFGFLLVRPIKPPSVANEATWQILNPNDKTVTILYYVSAITFVVSQIMSFVMAGIPILMESRLLVYREGGGAGIFGRIIAVTSLITIFLMVDRQFNQNKQNLAAKLFDFYVFLFTLFALFSSGSKAALLGIVFIVFYYEFFFRHFRRYFEVVKKVKRFQRKFFIIAVFGAFSALFIELAIAKNDYLNPLFAMLLRFIQSGDIYMFAYPENALELMAWSNPLIVMFSDFIGMLRIMPWENLPENLGSQLYKYFINSDQIKGPNPIHNVFGLFYFGYWGSFLYSFGIGFFLSLLRNKFIFMVPKSKLGGVVFMLVSLPLLSVYADFSYAISSFDNVLLVGFPLIVFVIILTQLVSVICRKPSPRVSAELSI